MDSYGTRLTGPPFVFLLKRVFGDCLLRINEESASIGTLSFIFSDKLSYPQKGLLFNPFTV